MRRLLLCTAGRLCACRYHDAMTNGKRKGTAGEREAAHAWTDATGLPCRRSQQYAGGHDNPDLLVSGGLLHPEVKRLRRIAILNALRQAEADAAVGAIPFGLIREDGDTAWAVLVRLDQLVALADELTRQRQRQQLDSLL